MRHYGIRARVRRVRRHQTLNTNVQEDVVTKEVQQNNDEYNEPNISRCFLLLSFLALRLGYINMSVDVHGFSFVVCGPVVVGS